MSQYIIKITDIEGYITAGYNDNGHLNFISLTECEPTDVQRRNILDRIPRSATDLLDWQKKYPKVSIKEVPVDLSFERFWNLYNYKQGKKSKAEKLWSQLSEEVKAIALVAVPKYNKWLGTKSIDKAYPETWLAQCRWENEYK